ncbi:hypothetical protein GLE_4703 [Lysobacter enzymogenes]|uniref:Uncharacterized protein n=1 Tax=Lysobacter enzymogenes TaxID=69 RepID=A0A0S2DND6_LYSEN|nr:hypothetical protein GLE_4703 [Lysobacter enzymogenes]
MLKYRFRGVGAGRKEEAWDDGVDLWIDDLRHRVTTYGDP